jgi:hypothetical protein
VRGALSRRVHAPVARGRGQKLALAVVPVEVDDGTVRGAAVQTFDRLAVPELAVGAPVLPHAETRWIDDLRPAFGASGAAMGRRLRAVV